MKIEIDLKPEDVDRLITSKSPVIYVGDGWPFGFTGTDIIEIHEVILEPVTQTGTKRTYNLP